MKIKEKAKKWVEDHKDYIPMIIFGVCTGVACGVTAYSRGKLVGMKEGAIREENELIHLIFTELKDHGWMQLHDFITGEPMVICTDAYNDYINSK